MTSSTATAGTLLAQARAAFPRGGLLPAANWRRRHIALSLVLVWHFPVLLAFALWRGYAVEHSLLDAALPLLFGGLAFLPGLDRGWRSISVATGLITSSIVLVHLSGGVIEMHLHFFVMVALLSLYQDWKPFLLAIAVTVLEHGITGVVAPHSVYNHQSAWDHPWAWAFLHGVFVLAASAAGTAAWSMSEADHRRHKADTALLHAQRVALLSHEAGHDALTGLANRRTVLSYLESASERARQDGTLFGVLFLDLDRFKHVNDTYGHLVGDVLLKAVADRLRSTVRGNDVAGRLGGDEFVVLLEGLTDASAVEQAAARVQRALDPPVRVDDEIVLLLTASIGHVVATGEEHWEDLIERADLDMYRVKHLGRGNLRARSIPKQVRQG
ncbi:MAG TPA: GGDEF domain-containing protein [Mycobacteriales bacterium]|nr:GGDEF domain-containing protein [Mycobacteriales bacterium]